MEFTFNDSYESIDVIPEDFRGLYQDQEGKPHLIKEGPAASAVKAIKGLNGALKKSRDELTTAKRTQIDLSPLNEFGATPEEIKAAFEAQVEELQTKAAGGEKNLDALRAEMQKGFTTKENGYKSRIEALTSVVHKLKVTDALSTAISKEKGVPELLMPFAEKNVRVVEEGGEFKVFVFDDKGEKRFSQTTGEFMTPEEYVKELKANPAYGRLFDSSTPSGGGSNPNGPGRKQQPARQSTEEMSGTQKIAAGLSKGLYTKGR